jgi:hypothetical protein
MRLASVAICLVTFASFGLFALNQTSSASAHQQRVLNGEATPSGGGGAPGAASSSSTGPGASHEGSVRRVIDEASNTFTSPFSGITSGWSSQWLIRLVKLCLALAVYGFALGFLARIVSVRS